MSLISHLNLSRGREDQNRKREARKYCIKKDGSKLTESRVLKNPAHYMLLKSINLNLPKFLLHSGFPSPWFQLLITFLFLWFVLWCQLLCLLDPCGPQRQKSVFAFELLRVLWLEELKRNIKWNQINWRQVRQVLFVARIFSLCLVPFCYYFTVPLLSCLEIIELSILK